MKLCLEMVEEGGFVCLVLPQVFLLAKNAAFLRQKIFKSFDVRCLVDLSAVSVFEKVGTYSILLVLQKRIAYTPENPPAHIAKRDLTQTIEETEIDSRNPERLPWASAACAAVARI
jgi:type I restriction-modification system DNA methylase subunit